MKHIITLLICLISFNSYGQYVQKCNAITKNGTYCTRKAVKAGYCKQHYTIKTSPKVISKPVVDLPEEWEAISSNPRQPDVIVAWRDTTTNTLYISFRK